MTQQNTGGPAFPATEEHGCNSGWSGMTLRDYFAAKAMQGMAATGVARGSPMEQAAEYAYAVADAMLKARKQQ